MFTYGAYIALNVLNRSYLKQSKVKFFSQIFIWFILLISFVYIYHLILN